MSALAGYLRPGSGRLVVFDLEATEDAHKFHPADFEVLTGGGGGGGGWGGSVQFL